MHQSLREVKALLAGLARLPAVTLEIDDTSGVAGVRVGAELVAWIDLRNGGVLVHTPAVTIPALQRVFPSARRAADGIAFDADDSSHAVAAIRRRVKVQRLLWQFLVASP